MNDFALKYPSIKQFVIAGLLCVALVICAPTVYSKTLVIKGFAAKQEKTSFYRDGQFLLLLAKQQVEHEDSHYFLELFRWNRLAARNGSVIAQFKLGVMYRDGIGTLQDFESAAIWFKRAANQGHELAQYNLGVMYRDGLGVGRDYTKAMGWLFLAAQQGNAAAKYNIGAMYHFGTGVKQDHKTAFSWYLAGAELGDEDSQYNLGWLYATGQGVRQDKTSAYMWLHIVASKGDSQAAELRDAFAKGMSESEIELAKEFARECEIKKYKDC